MSRPGTGKSVPPKVSLNPQATDDLRELADWTTDRAGPDTADAYLQRVAAKCDALADYPRRGRPRTELADTLHSIPFEGRLTILYRVHEDDVEIMRVVNGARDLSKLIPPLRR